jgi:hypothetical protein
MSAFDKLAASLAGQKGVSDPRGLAAAIGRKKYGGAAMAQASAGKESVQSVLRKRRK